MRRVKDTVSIGLKLCWAMGLRGGRSERKPGATTASDRSVDGVLEEDAAQSSSHVPPRVAVFAHMPASLVVCADAWRLLRQWHRWRSRLAEFQDFHKAIVAFGTVCSCSTMQLGNAFRLWRNFSLDELAAWASEWIGAHINPLDGMANAWLLWTEVASKLLRKAQQLQSHRCRRIFAPTLKVWAAALEESVRIRWLLSIAYACWRRSGLRWVLSRWNVQGLCARLSRWARAHDRYARSTRGWRSWRRDFQHRTDTLHTLRGYMLFAVHHLLSRSLRMWSQGVAPKNALRLASAHFAHMQLPRIWHRWRCLMDETGLLRLVLVSALISREKREITEAMQHWRMHHRLSFSICNDASMTVIDRLGKIVDQHRLRKCITHWRFCWASLASRAELSASAPLECAAWTRTDAASEAIADADAASRWSCASAQQARGADLNCERILLREFATHLLSGTSSSDQSNKLYQARNPAKSMRRYLPDSMSQAITPGMSTWIPYSVTSALATTPSAMETVRTFVMSASELRQTAEAARGLLCATNTMRGGQPFAGEHCMHSDGLHRVVHGNLTPPERRGVTPLHAALFEIDSGVSPANMIEPSLRSQNAAAGPHLSWCAAGRASGQKNAVHTRGVTQAVVNESCEHVGKGRGPGGSIHASTTQVLSWTSPKHSSHPSCTTPSRSQLAARCLELEMLAQSPSTTDSPSLAVPRLG